MIYIEILWRGSYYYHVVITVRFPLPCVLEGGVDILWLKLSTKKFFFSIAEKQSVSFYLIVNCLRPYGRYLNDHFYAVLKILSRITNVLLSPYSREKIFFRDLNPSINSGLLDDDQSFRKSSLMCKTYILTSVKSDSCTDK